MAKSIFVFFLMYNFIFFTSQNQNPLQSRYTFLSRRREIFEIVKNVYGIKPEFSAKALRSENLDKVKIHNLKANLLAQSGNYKQLKKLLKYSDNLTSEDLQTMLFLAEGKLYYPQFKKFGEPKKEEDCNECARLILLHIQNKDDQAHKDEGYNYDGISV